MWGDWIDFILNGKFKQAFGSMFKFALWALAGFVVVMLLGIWFFNPNR